MDQIVKPLENKDTIDTKQKDKKVVPNLEANNTGIIAPNRDQRVQRPKTSFI